MIWPEVSAAEHSRARINPRGSEYTFRHRLQLIMTTWHGLLANWWMGIPMHQSSADIYVRCMKGQNPPEKYVY